MVECRNELVVGWKDICMMNGRIEKLIHECMMNGWMEGYMHDEWWDGGMEG